MVKLSCIIPSWKDPFLHKTIDSLLDNSGLKEDELEIIVVLDAYWPTQPIRNDKRVRIIHHGTNTGMRGAINSGVRIARGEFIARFDEHCMVQKDWDKIVIDGHFADNWIMTLKRHELDPYKWEVISQETKDYSKLIIVSAEGKEDFKFGTVHWRSRNKKMAGVDIGETMGMQGSMWIMKKSWWDKVIVELQSEGYGTHYQDSVEMVFKTWQAGGKLMLNTKLWYAHKHRSFNRTHSYGGELARAGFKYAIDTWKPYYDEVIRPRFGV
jgi:glycosyltransferase involved in cell wall biosynthesis